MKTDMTLEEHIELLMFAKMHNKIGSLREKKSSLVHYTSAETALKIIKERKIWLRDTRCMNDVGEIEYGISITCDYIKKTSPLSNILYQIFPEITDENILALAKRSENLIVSGCYICCFSELRYENDPQGKLSMWRAYGSAEGSVGIAISPYAFGNPEIKIPLYSHPVMYGGKQKLFDEMNELAEILSKNQTLIREIGWRNFKEILSIKLLSWMTCLKHPDFKEEEEWRVLFLKEDTTLSDVIKPQSVSIKGTPQIVYTVPLEEIPDAEYQITSLSHILDKIIIGPSDYPEVISDALRHELENAGVANIESKIEITNIPLRTK